MRYAVRAAVLAASLLLSTQASALPTVISIDFDDLTVGDTLANQYAALRVTFAANAFSGAGSSSSGLNWATNTDMTIVSIISGTLGLDYGALGSPSLVANNILHRFENWQYDEDGDPSFNIYLNKPASDVSVTFAGIGGATLAPDTRLFIYSDSVLLGIVAASLPDEDVAQQTLSFTGNGISRIAVAPGSFLDWVGVDNIRITLIPAPGAGWLVALGLCALVAVRRPRS